jgi:hypothetical protein
MSEKLFTVIDGASFNPIGVFSDYGLALNSGERVTKDCFIILKFVLNGECTYKVDTMYESPRVKRMFGA